MTLYCVSVFKQYLILLIKYIKRVSWPLPSLHPKKIKIIIIIMWQEKGHSVMKQREASYKFIVSNSKNSPSQFTHTPLYSFVPLWCVCFFFFFMFCGSLLPVVIE